MSLLKIEVDADNVLNRQFTELEQKNLPFAVMQACNATVVEIRENWKSTARRVFDRPTPLTVNAVLYRKATKQTLAAEVYIRDEASKGTPPAKYLFPQVEGGNRGLKGMEKLLRSAEILPQGMFAVPGKGAELDGFGNVKSGQVRQIISQLKVGLESGYVSNESEDSRARRLRRQAKRGQRGGNFFALRQSRGRLRPGIYERVITGGAARAALGIASAVRSIFIFVRQPHYRVRYDIFALAQRQWNKLMPFHFNRELQKAVDTSKFRGRL